MGAVMTKDEYERTLTNAGASGSWHFYDLTFPHTKNKHDTDRRRVCATLRGRPFAEVDVRRDRQEALIVNGMHIPISSGYFTGYVHSFLSSTGATLDLARLRADVGADVFRIHVLSLRRARGKLSRARLVVTRSVADDVPDVVAFILVDGGQVSRFLARRDLPSQRVMLLLYMFAKLYNGDVAEGTGDGGAGAVAAAVSRKSMDVRMPLDRVTTTTRAGRRPASARPTQELKFEGISRKSMDMPMKPGYPDVSRRSIEFVARQAFPSVIRKSVDFTSSSSSSSASEFPAVRASLDRPATVQFPC